MLQLLEQIEELTGVAIDALKSAVGEAKGGGDGPPKEGGGKPPEGPPPGGGRPPEGKPEGKPEEMPPGA